MIDEKGRAEPRHEKQSKGKYRENDKGGDALLPLWEFILREPFGSAKIWDTYEKDQGVWMDMIDSG